MHTCVYSHTSHSASPAVTYPVASSSTVLELCANKAHECSNTLLPYSVYQHSCLDIPLTSVTFYFLGLLICPLRFLLQLFSSSVCCCSIGICSPCFPDSLSFCSTVHSQLLPFSDHSFSEFGRGKASSFGAHS